jgi:ankyrin repeat protein
VQDKLHGNTALHWAILAQNHTAVSILVMHGASLDITNAQVSVPLLHLSLRCVSIHSLFLSLVSPVMADNSNFFLGKLKSQCFDVPFVHLIINLFNVF